jgi:hypothetical protein
MVLFCSKLGAVFSYKVQLQNRGKERHAASMQRSSTGSSRATAFPESSGTALFTELASHHGLPGEKHLQEQVRHIHCGRHHFSFRRSPSRVPKALAIDSAAARSFASPLPTTCATSLPPGPCADNLLRCLSPSCCSPHTISRHPFVDEAA